MRKKAMVDGLEEVEGGEAMVDELEEVEEGGGNGG